MLISLLIQLSSISLLTHISEERSLQETEEIITTNKTTIQNYLKRNYELVCTRIYLA